MIEDLQHFYDLITCGQIEREECHRAVIVPGPATAVKVEAWLITHGLDDIITVACSPAVKAGTMLVIDERAIDAGMAEAMQVAARESIARLRGPTCPQCGAHGYGGRVWHRTDCGVGRVMDAYAFGLRVTNPSSLIRITGT